MSDLQLKGQKVTETKKFQAVTKQFRREVAQHTKNNREETIPTGNKIPDDS